MPNIEELKHFIANELMADGNATELSETTQLIDSGIIDSLGIMSLLGYLETNFSVEIYGDDLIPENFASIATINELLRRKCGGFQGEV